MKRSLAAVLAAGCLFIAGNAFALTVEEEIALLKEDMASMKAVDRGTGSIADVLGITVEGGGTIIMQGVDKANDGSDEGRHDATYSIDLGFGKEFSTGGRAFIHLESGNGDGLEGTAGTDPYVATYSGVNRDAGNSDNLVEVTEFWYEHDLFNDKFTVTFGKIDPTGYFDQNEYANDETTQFINPAFRNNAAISFTDNNLGLRVSYSPIDLIEITYAYMSTADDMTHIDMNGFNAVQVNVKPFENGNYRLMYWSSNEQLEKFENAELTGGYGFAASIDQGITDDIGVFGRFSWRDPAVYETSMAWSVGAQFGGSMWTRENDTVGLAVGQIMASSDWTDATGANDDSETQTELYYSFAITEHLAITPALQYIMKPAGGNAIEDNDIFVYGIRTQITF